MTLATTSIMACADSGRMAELKAKEMRNPAAVGLEAALGCAAGDCGDSDALAATCSTGDAGVFAVAAGVRTTGCVATRCTLAAGAPVSGRWITMDRLRPGCDS